jgi:hypothetical protein
MTGDDDDNDDDDENAVEVSHYENSGSARFLKLTDGGGMGMLQRSIRSEKYRGNMTCTERN